MRSCTTFLCVVTGILTLLSAAVFAASPNDPEVRLEGVRVALGVMFDDEHVAQDALRVHIRAMGMDPETRFEMLSRWVLPSADHQTLRMQIEFTPTCPGPANDLTRNRVASEGEASAEHANPVSNHRKCSGGDLVCPAMDLVNVARHLQRLVEIETVVEQWSVRSAEDEKSRNSFLLLTAIARDDQNAAEQRMREMLALATNSPGFALERHAEAVAVWAGGDYPATRELARELAVHLNEDVRSGVIRRSERWKRHIAARQFQISLETPSGLEKSAGMTSEGVATTRSSLKNWIPVSRMTAETRGTGYPVPVWQTSRGHAMHVAGHDHDYLYFASPLTGDFSVEADLTTFGYRDIHLGFGGYWAGSHFDLRSCVNGNFRSEQALVPIDPPLTRMFESMRVRLEVRQGKQTTFVNGREVFQRQHRPGDDPWLTIHSWWLTHGLVKNLRVLGNPVIPADVKLINPDLAGWIAYFDESVSSPNADWIIRKSVPSGTNQGSDTSEIVGRRRDDLHGTFSQSLLQYHRPMAEDGTIEYEFFYEPQKSMVHPALDRYCLLLNPAGVDVHWITDGRYDPALSDRLSDSDNLISDPQKHGGMLPFIVRDWNALALTVKGDSIELTLNGLLVFSGKIEPGNLRTFGLFHYAEQTEARIRNLRWRGNWPKSLSVPPEQELATNEVESIVGNPDRLPIVFAHDFRNGMPTGLLSVVGTELDEHLRQMPNGVQLNRPGGEYVNYSIVSPVVLTGDFDITATFEDFACETEANGESNIQLSVTLDDDKSSEFYLFRKVFVVPPDTHEQLVQAAMFQKREGETQYSFFQSPAEESNSGRMRLIRRGHQLSYLYAQENSTEFRLLHTESVSDADATVKLVNGQNKSGYARVTWKSLEVRSEGSFGVPDQKLRTIVQLDQERSGLSAKRTFSFSAPNTMIGAQGLEPFAAWSHPNAEYSRDEDGLKILVPGSENWQAAGLALYLALEGDFDVSLELEVLHMEPSKKYDESVVLLQTEFNDSRKLVSEVKYSIHHGGDRRSETQLRRVRKDGTFNYQELVSRPDSTATLLRLARRGDIIYQIIRAEPNSPEEILSVMKIGTDPVPSGFLRALIHTGGENRKTVIRFRSIRICAERIVEG